MAQGEGPGVENKRGSKSSIYKARKKGKANRKAAAELDRETIFRWLLHCSDNDACWVLDRLFAARSSLKSLPRAPLNCGDGSFATDSMLDGVSEASHSDAEEIVDSVKMKKQAHSTPTLWIVAPNVQAACAGQYDLVRGERANGRPLWRKRQGSRWLYASTHGTWHVGDQLEKEQGFRCDGGFMCCEPAFPGAMPDAAQGRWHFWDGSVWQPDPAIEVTARTPEPPKYLRLATPHAQSACAGVYELVEGEAVDGQHLWSMEGGGRWLYSLNGKWTVGDESSRSGGFRDHAGFIHCDTLHGGLSPDLVAPGCWKRWDDQEWLSDADIVVKAVSQLEAFPGQNTIPSITTHSAAPVLQFSSSEYIVVEDAGHVHIDVLRLGDCSMPSEVAYTTEDRSAKAGRNYTAMSGTLVFGWGEYRKKIEIPIEPDDDWSNTLEFEVALIEDSLVNAMLGQFSRNVRIYIINDDSFPTKKYQHCFETGDKADRAELGDPPPWGLFLEYLRMNWKNPVVFKGSLKTLLLDQLHNVHDLVGLLIDVFLVDKVLVNDDEDGALRQIGMIIGIRLAFFGLLHFLDWQQLFWRVGGASRKTLQSALFRRFILFEGMARAGLKAGDFSSAITRDSSEIVSDGYLKALSVPKRIGKLILMAAFPIVNSLSTQAEVRPLDILMGCAPIVLLPIVLVPFLVARYPAVNRALLQRNCAENEIVTWIQQLVTHCRLIQDYHREPWAVDEMDHRIAENNNCIIDASEVVCTNSYFAEWATLVIVLAWMMFGGVAVVQGEVSVGMFVAMLSIYKTTGDEWKGIYKTFLSIEEVLPALTYITRVLNRPSEQLRKRVHLEARVAKTLEGFRWAHAQGDPRTIDKLEFILEDMRIPATKVMRLAPKGQSRASISVKDRKTRLDGAGSHKELVLRTDTGCYVTMTQSMVFSGKLQFAQGKVVCLTGPHVSGKSTILRLIGGSCLASEPEQAFAPSHLRILQVAFHPTFMRGSLLDNLLFGVDLSERRWETKQALKARAIMICQRLCVSAQLLDLIETEAHLEVWSEVLSSSQAFLLNLARAFVADPEVLCVNLPNVSLEPRVAEEVWSMLQEFVKDRGCMTRFHAEGSVPLHAVSRRRPRTCILTTLAGLNGSGASAYPGHSWVGRADVVYDITDDKEIRQVNPEEA